MTFFTKLTFFKKHAKLARAVLTFSFMVSVGAASQYQTSNNASEMISKAIEESMKSSEFQEMMRNLDSILQDAFSGKISKKDAERKILANTPIQARPLTKQMFDEMSQYSGSADQWEPIPLENGFSLERLSGRAAEARARQEESDRRAAEAQARRAAEEQKRQEMQAAQAAEARARQEESDRRAAQEQARRAAEEQKRQEMQAAQAAEAQRLAEIENAQVNEIKAILNTQESKFVLAEKIGPVFKKATDKLALYRRLDKDASLREKSILNRAIMDYSN
ncbi:MAG: hypothetical protein NEHIOOID_00040 [Holosporales bacterium]